jgi:arylsulfatase A-like enzyme/phosphodiesterase/alkaline phosphatase D-like protein
MKRFLALACLLPLALNAHTLPSGDKEALRAHILEEFMQKSAPKKVKPVEAPIPKTLKRPVTVAGLSGFDLSSFLTSGSALPPAGNGLLMAASFAPFKPKVRYNWDGTTFFLESDNTPEGMPNKMFGITTWQQQVPIPAAYFAHSTSNENNAGSLGYQQPNVWRIPLVPVPSASPIVIYNPPAPPTNFLRGAVALASNGIAIFNPSNNGGNVSYEIGELDYYGGHCGLADDYHYHIAPTHLNTRFGGPLGDDKPIAWALDGYPMYGFLEPDGSPRQALDAEGGHDHGGGWGYHYHAMGTTTVDATHPYGTPQSPYLMKAFHGTVVNFGNQVDGQPAVGNLRADGTGGYNAKAVAGAYIVAQMNPAPLVTDGSGHLSLVAGVNLTGCATTYGSTTVTCASTTGLTTGLAVVGYGVSNGARVTSVTNATQFVLSIPAIATTTGKNFTAVSMATASPDAHVMRVNMGGVDYDEYWTINRKVNPRSLTMTWRAQALVGGVLSGPVLTTTQTYTPTAGTAPANRLTAYPMGAWSEVKLPDTSQVVSTTTTFGEDSDYTTTPSANPQSFTDNGDGTITDNVTGLMWQKADAAEMTWENAVNNAGTVTTGGYSDWRLPNPHELMSLFNYETGNPAMNATYFPPASPSAEYWWSRDVFGTSTTNVWCVNSGGGVGPKPKAETVSAGGTLRYHARYVRLAQNNMTHNYVNNLDCTITDTDTSLMWTQMPSTAMTWEAALAWAEGLTLGGYNDWRMPNIKELQTLTDYSLATTSGGTATNLKPAINRTMFAKTMSGCSVTSGSPVVATSDTTDLAVGMTVIDPFSIAGAYINHTTTPTITAINPGVSFTLSSNALSTGTGLIFRALPRATAYWSSTSNKGTQTEAWLLELGVNNSVPVAEGPPRGAQGIISYQAKTASFPVFAVRTATLTTQIAVAQGATSLTDGLSTVAYGNVNVGSTLSKTFTITNTGSTPLDITGVTIDGTNSANFSVITSPTTPVAANNGTSTFTVQFNASTFGTKTAVLHIASSDAGNPSFDINLSGIAFVPPPTVSNITINPISPSSTDPAVVTAQVAAGSGGGISGVTLTYDLGAQVTGNVFRETFSMASSNNWNGSGGLNTWTTNGAGATRQANLQSNRTSPVVLTNCTTTSASTSVVCSSTANLWPNMIITGPGMAAGAVISSITNGTTFVISAAATASSTTTTLTANGITLTNCTTTAASTTVTCDSTTGLVAGMGLTGTGLANNATVSSITNSTTFVMSAAPTTPGTALTLTGNGNALEFQAASASLTTAMATSPVINAAGTSGYVDFYVQTRDLNSLSPNNQWAFQVSPDGGTTWNTRLTEDWTGSTVTLTNVVTNAAGSGTGSTTVTCASTAGLTTGRAVSAAPVYVTGGTTSGSATVTCTNTTGLAVGMFVTSTGTTIPANTRITAINPNVDFTMSANAAATSATAAIAGNYFPANASVSSITNGTTFVLNAAAYVNTSAAPITAFATTINHNFNTKADGTAQPYRYTLDASERTANMRMRFQYAGGTVTQPTRAPRVSIDDIVVNTTSGAPPTVIAMTDLGGGLWSATIPPQANGATVNFTIAATGTGGAGTTTSSTTSYTVAPAPTITTASPLPNGSTTGAYSQTFAATGGSGTGYVWSLFSGSLPNGLTLSSGGVLSGTPTQAGNFNFTIEVTDSANRSATKAFALTITTVTAPNVVVIITDDQGWGDVGYHTPAGQVPIQTPNMDSFGTTRPGSIRLERFYATTVCSVTRSTMLTGRNPIRHATNNTRGTDLSEHLMPQTFKAAGYQTFMCGKWHMGGSDKNLHHTLVNGVNTRIIQEGLQYAPFNRGFDSHYGQYSGAIDYYTHNSAEADSLDIPDWWLNGVQQDGPSEHTDSQGTGGWSPNLLADKAIAHIQNRNPSQPFYLHLAFNSIHGPVSAPANLITKYQNLGVTNTSRRLISAAVDGMDQAMGRVLNALDAAGVTNNTVILWFGDNGGDETKGSLNDPLRGDKGDSYDGGLREVAGISYPGVLPSGIISHQYMWVGDVFPTLCAAVGVTPQNTKPFDGVNVWPNLLTATSSTTTTLRPGNATLVTDAAAPIAINKFTDPVNGGTKDFKLRRGRVANVITPELFNLTDDPLETTDLIANPAYASIVTSLTNSVTAISAENFKPYIGPPLITNAAAQGSTIELYAPFTSYPNGTITVQWRKNGSNLSNGGNVSGATSFTQVTDNASAIVRGAYTTKLTLTNVQPSDAATYDVVITNTAGNTTSASGVLTVTMPAPALTLPAFTKGTSITLNWTAVPGATGYTIQRSTTSDFASVTSQTTSSTSVTFSGLTSGTTYYYRGTATDGTNTSAFGNTASSTQDASTPVVTITAPANNTTTTANSIIVSGTATDTISSLTAVVVNGVNAVSSDNYATWTATVPLTPGANTLTATSTDSADQGGNTGSASINVTYNANGPAIVSVGTGPTAPTYLDPTTVLAQITPQPGTTLTSVQLQYDTGTPVSTAIWKETFNNTSSNNWNGTGALNAWTTVGAGNLRQAVSTSNRTAISLTSVATTSGSTTVTCASTAALWPGMLITGPNIAGSINGTQTGNSTVASITNATTFVLSQAATGTGTGLTLTACGVTLTNATTTAASTAVTCDSTAGLVNGMSLTGTGLANNATVASVTSATTFTMNAAPTTAGTALTLSATTAAAEFNGGTADPLASMFTTTNAINTTGASGFIEFYVQTRDLFATNNCGWTLQVSSDNGATWNTRLSEDWNAETVSLSNVVLNAASAVAGSTTVTCASTAGLTTGRSVLAAPVNATIGITTGSSTATCTNTTGLVEGMFITATGIPNNTRIGTITPNTSFTLVTGTTATLVNATATNAAANAAANYFAGAATVSSITNATTFVLSTAAYANTSAAPLANAFATTVNHGFQLFHYDLAGAELGTQTKIRFQATGYAATAPTRTPRISIDDIVIATTAPPPTITLAMFDDGLHGDGAANDGVWGAVIPAQNGGTTINFKVVATDNTNASATSPGSGNYIYTVNNLLTDATILGAEFLTLPKTDGVTVNLIASANQQVFVEYGTAPGQYTLATTPTTFNIDNAKPEFKNPIRIPITGLQPDTEYYYRVRHRNVGATFYNARGERSFHTARPRGTTFSFTVTADPHIDVNTDMQLFWRAMQNISLDQPDIHMDVGDIFMTDKLADGLLGVPPKWGGGVTINQTSINNRAIIFRNAFERACHSIPFFFGLGNHEAEYGYLFNAATDKQNNIPAWDLKARKAFYPAPTPDGFYAGNPTPKDYTGGTLGLLEDYYAFEWGEALFIMLDPFWNTMTNPNSSNDAWKWSLGKAQYDWLRDTLKNSSARYKFVFMHHIVGGSTQTATGTAQYAARGGIEVSDKYEWGGKNADGSPGFATQRPGWDMPIHDLLVMNKVNVVFHGHDHLYGYQTKDGVVYLECPQPGTPNYTSLGSAADGQYVNLGANSTSYLLPNSGHIRVTVGPDQAVADYVRSYRTATDPMPPDATSVFNDETPTRINRSISHSFVLAPKVSPPIEVANVAPGQVGLRWNAIPNKPYQIQWSTDLITWTTIETLTFTNTNTNATYTDNLPARVNGQRAFYRVVWNP